MRAQKVRPPQVEQQMSVQTSTAVCESVLVMAISNVCYSRGLFEPDDFDTKPLAAHGLPMQRMLKKNARTAELWRWITEGVVPALKERCLDKVLFIISADAAGENGTRARACAREPHKPPVLRRLIAPELLPVRRARTRPHRTTVLEVFSFTCTYNDTPNYKGKLRSREGMVQQASAMLSLLGTYTESSAPLPSQPTFLRIELVYNDRAPEGYAPKGELFTTPREAAGRSLSFADKEVAIVDLRNVNTPHQSLKSQLFTTSIKGMWEEEPQLEHGTLAIGADAQAMTGGSRSTPGGSSSPTFGNSASQGVTTKSNATSKEELIQLYKSAKTTCAKLGGGAIVNVKVLQAHVPGLKPLDACMILCRLEMMQVIGPLDHDAGGRKVLAGDPASAGAPAAEAEGPNAA
jgi:hypothetical protein